MEQKTVHFTTFAFPRPFAWFLVKEVHQEHYRLRQTVKYEDAKDKTWLKLALQSEIVQY